MNVLFVCTGNICRSPMAEAVGRALCGEDGPVFASAGLAAVIGAPASHHAVEAASAMGGDASGHTARQFDDELGAWADRIYVMTPEHLAWMQRFGPEVAASTELLDPAGASVPDPYGRDRAAYLMAAGQITAAIEARRQEWLSAG